MLSCESGEIFKRNFFTDHLQTTAAVIQIFRLNYGTTDETKKYIVVFTTMEKLSRTILCRDFEKLELLNFTFDFVIFLLNYLLILGFKGCVSYILYILATALVKLGKMSFISFQKLFSFLRKSKFRILDIPISWRYQIPKHKTRNTFYWITWEVNTVC